MKTPRVPDRVTSPVKRLRNRLVPGGQPIYVSVRPEQSAEVNDCFVSVENKIKLDGGGVQYGWAIWYLPGILMEAEFHVVWISPMGEYIDISPRSFHFNNIMFLPDPKRIYAGKQLDNIRIPLSKDPKVKEFIHLMEERFKIMNEGKLSKQHGLVSIPREKLEPIEERLAELSLELLKD